MKDTDEFEFDVSALRAEYKARKLIIDRLKASINILSRRQAAEKARLAASKRNNEWIPEDVALQYFTNQLRIIQRELDLIERDLENL